MRVRSGLRGGALVSAAWMALCASQALAQEPAPASSDPASNVTAYKPEFFAEWRPLTAMDMIGRIPGFAFDGGSFARGFAGTAGNVLIDGERPPSRNDSLVSVLSRIPASSVERIDVIQGGAAGIDMQGKAVVANVIRRKNVGIKGAAAAGAGFDSTGMTSANTSFQATREANGRTFEGEISLNTNQSSDESERLRLDPAGVVLLQGGSTSSFGFDSARAVGSFETPLLGGKLRLNGQGTFDRNSNAGQDVLIIPGGSEDYGGEGEGYRWEAGARFSRPLPRSMAMELVLFRQASHSENESYFDTPSFTSTNVGISDSGESIVGLNLTLPKWRRLSFETGGESVFNFTEGVTAFGFNGAPLSISGDAVRVEEERADAFFTTTFNASSRLSLVAAVRYEQSTISTDGTAGAIEKTLRFVKPRFTASITPKAGHQVNLRLERVVDQLSFGAFRAAANFSTGVFGIGNADIEPEKSWVYDIRYEYRFGRQGSFVLQAVRRDIEDVLARVVLEVPPAIAGDPVTYFDITRNLGTIRRDSLSASLRLPLDDYGLKGGFLNLRAGVRESFTIDPVTNVPRRASGENPWDWSVGLNQTIQKPAISWSVNYSSGFSARNFGTRGFGYSEGPAFYGASINWRPKPDLSVGASVSSGGGFFSTSTFFGVPRYVIVPPLYTETSRSTGRPSASVSIRKSF